MIKTASVWLMNARGEFLLQLRAPNVKNPNKWGMSAGGWIDAGESPADTVKRETMEELGIDIPVGQFVFLGDFFNTENPEHQTHPHIYFAKGDWEISDIRFQESEIAAVKYVSLAEIKKIIGTFVCAIQPQKITLLEEYLYKEQLN
ncbi:MAG: NUDIX domain-containing protein [Alphaproteobacteria bacterium]|nr:NUDIX domain-containing protein [Alphaproteobacteria bacterium]